MFRLIINTSSNSVTEQDGTENDVNSVDYIDLEDSGAGFEYTSLLFRYQDLLMTRSFNISIPATPHNNMVLGFGNDPAASGDELTQEMGCTLVFDGGQISGNMIISEYSDHAYNASVTLEMAQISSLRDLAQSTDLRTVIGSANEEDDGEGTGTQYNKISDPATLSIVLEWNNPESCRSGSGCKDKAPEFCMQRYFLEGTASGTFYAVCHGNSGFVAVGPTLIVGSADGKNWQVLYNSSTDSVWDQFYDCAAYDSNSDSSTQYFVRGNNSIYSFTGLTTLEGGADEGDESVTLKKVVTSNVGSPIEDEKQSGRKWAPLDIFSSCLYWTNGKEVYKGSISNSNSTITGTKITGGGGKGYYTMTSSSYQIGGTGDNGNSFSLTASSTSLSTFNILSSDKGKAGYRFIFGDNKWLALVDGKSGKGGWGWVNISLSKHNKQWTCRVRHAVICYVTVATCFRKVALGKRNIIVVCHFPNSPGKCSALQYLGGVIPGINCRLATVVIIRVAPVVIEITHARNAAGVILYAERAAGNGAVSQEKVERLDVGEVVDEIVSIPDG